MSPQPQLSLCIPDSMPASDLQEFYDNVNQFFLKFPLQYEVLFASGQDGLPEICRKDPRFKVVITSGERSRSAILEALFAQATGDILIASSLDLAIPLGDLFRLLQELYTEKDLQVVFCNRFGKKKNLRSDPVVVARSRLEAFFQTVILEKTHWPFQDLFCPVLAIRRTAYEKLKPFLKPAGWHWTHELQRSSVKAGLKTSEIDVYEGTRKENASAGWREALRLLGFVVFRI